MDNEMPERKRLRLKHFDYGRVGAYFITICTENRRCILSQIVGGDVLDAPPKTMKRTVGGDFDAPNEKHVTRYLELLPYGEIADKYIQKLNDFYEHIKVDKYVIMPDHIHILLFLLENDGASRTSPPTKQHSSVSQFVSTFKRMCNKEYGKNIWQRSYYDHIIRNSEDYDEVRKYINGNPRRWLLKKQHNS